MCGSSDDGSGEWKSESETYFSDYYKNSANQETLEMINEGLRSDDRPTMNVLPFARPLEYFGFTCSVR